MEDNLYEKGKSPGPIAPIGLLRSGKLTPLEKLCWILLCSYTYKDPNFAFVNQKKLADDLGITKGRVSQIMRSLTEKKLIAKGKKLNKFGKIVSGYYLLDNDIFNTEDKEV